MNAGVCFVLQTVRVNFLFQMPQNSPVNREVHDDVEDRTERGDAVEVRKDRQRDDEYDCIDKRVLLDVAGHSEMSVRNELHFTQHRQHPRYGKGTGEQSRDRCHHGQADREVTPPLPERGFCCFG